MESNPRLLNRVSKTNNKAVVLDTTYSLEPYYLNDSVATLYKQYIRSMQFCLRKRAPKAK